jgi:hypothetical protein
VGREPEDGDTALILAAPTTQSGSVRLTTPDGKSRTIDVEAGHSVETYITDTLRAKTGPWSFVVTSTGDGPVYVVRMLLLHGDHGALVTAEPVVPLPQPLPLPAVRQDPRIAVR